MKKVVKYVVRVPGSTSWSEHKTLSAAQREAETANRVVRPGHQVFAEHQDGAVTGPYPKGARLEA
jgi:hypothetical protein